MRPTRERKDKDSTANGRERTRIKALTADERRLTQIRTRAVTVCTDDNPRVNSRLILSGSGDADTYDVQTADGAKGVIFVQQRDPPLTEFIHNHKIGCSNLPDKSARKLNFEGAVTPLALGGVQCQVQVSRFIHVLSNYPDQK